MDDNTKVITVTELKANLGRYLDSPLLPPPIIFPFNYSNK